MKTTIALYRTGSGWRWQMRDARNGRIIGAATEGYDRRAACLKNLERVSGYTFAVQGRQSRYTRTVTLGERHSLIC